MTGSGHAGAAATAGLEEAPGLLRAAGRDPEEQLAEKQRTGNAEQGTASSKERLESPQQDRTEGERTEGFAPGLAEAPTPVLGAA